MHDILLNGTEDPLQHVIEMHADIGGDAAALMYVALPRSVIPLAARGDVCQVHVIDLVHRALVHLLLQRSDAVMKAELEDVVSLMAGLLLHLHQRIDIVRIEHHRLLADDIASQTQTIADERIMSVVRGAYAQPVQRFVRLHLPRAEPVEKLVFRKERTLREEAVQPPDAVEAVVCRQQVVTGILDCLQVSRGYVPRRTYQCEISHITCYASDFFDPLKSL